MRVRERCEYDSKLPILSRILLISWRFLISGQWLDLEPTCPFLVPPTSKSHGPAALNDVSSLQLVGRWDVADAGTEVAGN